MGLGDAELSLAAEGWIEELLAMAAELSQVFASLKVTRDDKPRQAQAILAARSIDGLRAVRALKDVGADDQVYVVGRSMFEDAISALYLLGTTRRNRQKGGPIDLTAAQKADLFMTHHQIGMEQAFGVDNVTSYDLLGRAIALRVSLGLEPLRPFWHCSGPTALLKEVQQVATGDLARDEQFAYLGLCFRHLSSFTHPNPMIGIYLRETGGPGSPIRLKDNQHHADAAAYAALAAVYTLTAWGVMLGRDMQLWRRSLVGRILSALSISPDKN